MATTAGNRNLITDVKGLRVGQAHDARIKTGVTVILPDEPAVAACAVAGGGPGTRETDLLSAGAMVDYVDAVFLSGGSAFGLGAADGVMAGLKRAGRGFSLIDRPGVPPTPIVPGAILYDLANGGNKDWDGIAPYGALGLEAFEAASVDVLLGRAGAGHGALAGQYPGGTGSASAVTADGMTVGAIACVNCFGSVQMPGTDAYWAWPYEIDGEFGGARPPADFSMDVEDWGAAKGQSGARAEHHNRLHRHRCRAHTVSGPARGTDGAVRIFPFHSPGFRPFRRGCCFRVIYQRCFAAVPGSDDGYPDRRAGGLDACPRYCARCARGAQAGGSGLRGRKRGGKFRMKLSWKWGGAIGALAMATACVIGGREANPEDWPGVVSLQSQQGRNIYHECGATMVSS